MTKHIIAVVILMALSACEYTDHTGKTCSLSDTLYDIEKDNGACMRMCLATKNYCHKYPSGFFQSCVENYCRYRMVCP